MAVPPTFMKEATQLADSWDIQDKGTYAKGRPVLPLRGKEVLGRNGLVLFFRMSYILTYHYNMPERYSLLSLFHAFSQSYIHFVREIRFEPMTSSVKLLLSSFSSNIWNQGFFKWLFTSK